MIKHQSFATVTLIFSEEFLKINTYSIMTLLKRRIIDEKSKN